MADKGAESTTDSSKQLGRISIENLINQEKQTFELAASTNLFDMLGFFKQHGAKNSFCSMGVYLTNQQKDLVNMSTYIQFLTAIQAGYAKYDVQYHNDIHGTDVMQMTHYILNKGNLINRLKLSNLDVLATLVGAQAHDYAHDGMNNAYHTNAKTDRFEAHGSAGVQEKYHFAESYKLVEKYNFISHLNQNQQQVFKNRMMSCILATDMGRHADDLKKINELLEKYQVADGANVESLVTQQDQGEADANQQKILDLIVHSSDISQNARTFKCCHEWFFLLFDEFFQQGDIEKEQSLAISFLCDRKTTNVVQGQPGFAGFFVIPLFKAISNLSADLAHVQKQIEENVELWKTYEETDEDKKVYVEVQWKKSQPAAVPVVNTQAEIIAPKSISHATQGKDNRVSIDIENEKEQQSINTANENQNSHDSQNAQKVDLAEVNVPNEKCNKLNLVLLIIGILVVMLLVVILVLQLSLELL